MGGVIGGAKSAIRRHARARENPVYTVTRPRMRPARTASHRPAVCVNITLTRRPLQALSGRVMSTDVEPPPSLVRAALQADYTNTSRAWALPALMITEQERASLSALVHAEHQASRLNIEWVVDVADNNLNWFIATAYIYDDESRTIRVAIPDRNDPE